MIDLSEMTSPTRSVGLVAYLTAIVCCSVAWLRSRGTSRAQLPALLGFIEAALFIDMASNARWLIHNYIEDIAIHWGLYSLRYRPQIFLTVLFTLGAPMAIAFVLRHYRVRRGASLAVSGTILSVSCWIVESVSLHAVDITLQFVIKRWMLVALIWIAGSLMTSTGVLLDARNKPAPKKTHRLTLV